MLVGSEKELAQKIAIALCQDKEDQEKITGLWEKVFGLLLSHLVEKTTVLGVSPPNGGPVQGGRIA